MRKPKPEKECTRNNWNVKPFPDQYIEMKLDLGFSPEEMEIIKQGHYPSAMEDKWFVFYEKNQLYFCRSWTGFCTYMVDFKEEKAVRVKISREQDQYKSKDDEFDLLMVVYMIYSFLLGRHLPFPKTPDSNDNILAKWSQMGIELFRKRE